MTRLGRRGRPLLAGLVAVALIAGALIIWRAGVGLPQPTSGGVNLADKTPQSTPVAIAGVPAAAWQRGSGAVLANPGVSSVTDYQIIDDGSLQGAPLGGMGAGSIGRTYRGDFARWHLAPGENNYGAVWADQFSVRVAREGAPPAARVLLPAHPSSGLSSWNWDYPADGGTYAALYPFAWYNYPQDKAGVTLTSRQFSPVIPNNYQESSYPVAIFEWTVTNDGSTPADVSLMFTWENSLGWNEGAPAGNSNAIRRATVDGANMLGVVLNRGTGAAQTPWEGQMAIAALETPGVQLSALGRFETRGDGASVWAPWAASGALPNTDDTVPSQYGQPIGAAIAAQTHLAPGESRKISFVLSWDLPIMQFGRTQTERWYKRYTEWFGKDGRHAWEIAATGLREAANWAAQLEKWQQPYLDNVKTPAWYKTALFNELYYLVDGGTIWENGRVGDDTPSRHLFSYLECYDYPFYSTLDVRFYGSYAQLMLWPEIEKDEMRFFADTIPMNDPAQYVTTDREHRMNAIRKVPGAAPHDVGAPFEAPWTRINAYDFQDVTNWKDLNSKFALLVYRDYVATADRAFLDYSWPAVKSALAYLEQFDTDGDGIPENTNFPDQTYDTWVMDGISAYCGSLWLASLEAGAAMADLEGDKDAAAHYRALFAKAQPRFEQALWNGKYYDYDTGQHYWHDSVMADQLAGQWYADATGLAPIVPADHAKSALETVFQLNVKGFGGGEMGAVNGIRPDGSPDNSNMQSLEVWTGTTYALAAEMLHRGMDGAAWATAYGVYKVTYETKGYWFRTPEAWNEAGNFRASMYMRPQAIWAMQWALDRRGK